MRREGPISRRSGVAYCPDNVRECPCRPGSCAPSGVPAARRPGSQQAHRSCVVRLHRVRRSRAQKGVTAIRPVPACRAGIAMPAGGSRCRAVWVCIRSTASDISSLMWPMARVGFSPFGQTSTQFMMVWQRNSLNGPSRLASRSSVAWSRLSARKRQDCSSAAGPRNLSGFHQNDGQEVEQQAHRMHSYRPSSWSRSAGALAMLHFRYRILIDQVGFDARYWCVELLQVDNQVADDRQAGQRPDFHRRASG